MSPKLYIKKPVGVFCMELTRNTLMEVIGWIETDGGLVQGYSVIRCEVQIETLEGVMTAKERDFIIKGVRGEFYPCKPDIFHATYHEAIS